MIELKEALQIVLNSARPLGSEQVDLSHALQRILAEDVASDVDMPPFDKSAMDGYACRRADLANNLKVIGTIPAGAPPAQAIGPGQCVKIMTGAAIPPGADCVIMVEQVERVGADVIRFAGGPTPGHICRKAEDIRRGQVVLRKGSRIGPQQIAVLAGAGCVRPLVARRPKAAVIATGNELVAPAASPGPSRIRNTNSPQLMAQLEAAGAAAKDYGIVADVAGDIDEVLNAALAQNDVLVISGGVSVGDFDLVPAALKRNSVELLFESIAMKPGKPTVFGRTGQAYCFGLPGNPVSTFVVFELLVRPLLGRLMGCDHAPVTVRMYLDESIARTNTDRQSWIPVKRTSETTVKAVEYHGSAHIPAMCEADGLISMDIGVAGLEKESPVRVRLL